MRLFVVDDNPDIRALFRVAALSHEQCELVGEARDAEEALLLASSARPDVLVVDQQMPGMSGIEALTLLVEYLPETRIVLYMSSPSAGIERQARARGADAVYDKSTTPRAVLAELLRHDAAPLV